MTGPTFLQTMLKVTSKKPLVGKVPASKNEVQENRDRPEAQADGIG